MELTPEEKEDARQAGREAALHDRAVQERKAYVLRTRIRDFVGQELERKREPRGRTLLSIAEAAKRLGYSKNAFYHKVRRRSAGFEHLSLPENREFERENKPGLGGGRFWSDAVLRCPRDAEADAEYWEESTEELKTVREAKRRFDDELRRGRP